MRSYKECFEVALNHDSERERQSKTVESCQSGYYYLTLMMWNTSHLFGRDNFLSWEIGRRDLRKNYSDPDAFTLMYQGCSLSAYNKFKVLKRWCFRQFIRQIRPQSCARI